MAQHSVTERLPLKVINVVGHATLRHPAAALLTGTTTSLSSSSFSGAISTACCTVSPDMTLCCRVCPEPVRPLPPCTAGAPTKTSYLTPATYSFYVWTLIDLLLLGTVILQFFDAGFEPIIEGIGFRFAIIGVLNGIWVSLFHHGHYIVCTILYRRTCSQLMHAIPGRLCLRCPALPGGLHCLLGHEESLPA